MSFSSVVKSKASSVGVVGVRVGRLGAFRSLR
jgi:hypothetical protein